MVRSCRDRQRSVNNLRTHHHVGHDPATRWVGVVEIHLGWPFARSPTRLLYTFRMNTIMDQSRNPISMRDPLGSIMAIFSFFTSSPCRPLRVLSFIVIPTRILMPSFFAVRFLSLASYSSNPHGIKARRYFFSSTAWFASSSHSYTLD
jgi:hypothetical protein